MFVKKKEEEEEEEEESRVRGGKERGSKNQQFFPLSSPRLTFLFLSFVFAGEKGENRNGERVCLWLERQRERFLGTERERLINETRL